jgi:hypothetical protein
VADPLALELEAYGADPLGFAKDAYPWGQGPLLRHVGPRVWQAGILGDIGAHLQNPATRFKPLRIAVASGHGVGKSALVGMIVDWAMSTCPETRIVVTANTEGQLRTKTWPEIAKWVRMSVNADWWAVPAMSMYERAHEKSWRADAIPWSINNTEGFAGLHNEGKRIVLIYDEASGIDDLLWEVSEGALTDANTEIIWIAFGNPTQNKGRFRECFGRYRHLWQTHQIDSRTVEGTNREFLDEMVKTYGEDSDYVKVRVRGIFPSAGSLQFIGRDQVDAAMARNPMTTKWAGRVAAVGVDVARFGDDETVIATRVGRDAQSIPIKRYRGLDTMQVASRVAEHVNEMRLLGLKVVLFIDGGGVGGGVVDRLRQLNFDPIEVQFGSKADDERKYANKRAEIWGRAKAWLEIGCLPKDEQLAADLTGVEYGFNLRDQILLESKKAMKERGLASPDAGDALACTFAQDVPEFIATSEAAAAPKREYDPFNIG